MKKITKKIGEFSYRIHLMPADKALKAHGELISILAPLVGAFEKGVDLKSVLDTDVSSLLSTVSDTVVAFQKSDPDMKFVKKLIYTCSVVYDEDEVVSIDEGHFNIHFVNKAPLMDVYQLALEVIIANGFLPQAVIGLLGSSQPSKA
jgi:hypothetical protein